MKCNVNKVNSKDTLCTSLSSNKRRKKTKAVKNPSASSTLSKDSGPATSSCIDLNLTTATATAAILSPASDSISIVSTTIGPAISLSPGHENPSITESGSLAASATSSSNVLESTVAMSLNESAIATLPTGTPKNAAELEPAAESTFSDHEPTCTLSSGNVPEPAATATLSKANSDSG
ncbi:hypothetical protein GYMLUDRAFT_249104 [Collybiopsis luxurians FD-317 M1]|uniref:Uncharacterized protein n=1 Tax=Collybiopsis luxurians FD-317 M1 TaxID=944289 RepID=A0A0D0BYI7_9AGAR|nr:hypothetical protein GYMLUDRAFT_249104 [Collybiopsis luxurians FD-317 M1]